MEKRKFPYPQIHLCVVVIDVLLLVIKLWDPLRQGFPTWVSGPLPKDKSEGSQVDKRKNKHVSQTLKYVLYISRYSIFFFTFYEVMDT